MSFDIRDCSTICWQGWWTTWDALRSAGWKITVEPAYSNWRQPEASAKSREKLYIRHPASAMIGRITQEAVESEFHSSDYTLDFLTQECNHRVKPFRIQEERDLTADDIPDLMGLILRLQAKDRKSAKRIKPAAVAQAEILLMRTGND